MSEVCSEFGIQKLSLLRELCSKTGKNQEETTEQLSPVIPLSATSTGVQLVLQDYDFLAKPTFTEDDIASLQPLVKHTNFRVCEGSMVYQVLDAKRSCVFSQPAEGVARFELAQSNLGSGKEPLETIFLIESYSIVALL